MTHISVAVPSDHIVPQYLIVVSNEVLGIRNGRSIIVLGFTQVDDPCIVP